MSVAKLPVSVSDVRPLIRSSTTPFRLTDPTIVLPTIGVSVAS